MICSGIEYEHRLQHGLHGGHAGDGGQRLRPGRGGPALWDQHCKHEYGAGQLSRAVEKLSPAVVQIGLGHDAAAGRILCAAPAGLPESGHLGG